MDYFKLFGDTACAFPLLVAPFDKGCIDYGLASYPPTRRLSIQRFNEPQGYGNTHLLGSRGVRLFDFWRHRIEIVKDIFPSIKAFDKVVSGCCGYIRSSLSGSQVAQK